MLKVTKPSKFGQLNGDSFVPHHYANTWDIEKTTGPERLIIAPATDHVDLVLELSRALPEPFFILYLLLVPRPSHEAGRYQCPSPCSRVELETFFTSFKEFFESDGRHHVWLMSFPAQSTIVYDQHNVIYAYGPLEKFTQILTRNGLSRESVAFPAPHAHHYNSEFDSEETRILNYWDWRKSALQPGDHL